VFIREICGFVFMLLETKPGTGDSPTGEKPRRTRLILNSAAGHRGHRDKAGEHREFEENAVDGNAHLRSELDGPNFRFTKPRSVISYRLSCLCDQSERLFLG